MLKTKEKRMVRSMPRNMCLFFVSVNHLVVLLNEFVSKLSGSEKIVVISDYDSEQLFLRWSHVETVVEICKVETL